jgi:hypothetical protein
MKSRTDIAERAIKLHNSLSAERAPWDSFWNDVAAYVMPRKGEITNSTHSPSTARQDALFDGTAIRANMVLANGQLAWMTPAEARWFSFDPPAALRGIDAVETYYKQCTEVAAIELSRSNFYSEIHELYLDRGCFGTAVLYAEPGKRFPIHFRKFDVGTFSILEDSEGYVDTLSREFELSVRQASQMFGEDNLSGKLQTIFNGKDDAAKEQKFKFIHQILPRLPEEIEEGKRDPENKPIASIYVEIAGKHVCRLGGYDEQPFFATRFLKWTSEHAYGWSPSWMALPESRQLNFLEKQMDALAELAAFPRFLIPDTHEGEVDFRAAGVTYFDPGNPNAIPKEWATSGRYDVGLERANQRRQAINDAFHVDLFQMFTQLQKQMTAREVSERSSEKLIQFSPTFARMTTELFTPLLRRVFSLLSRSGAFPPPPRELIIQDAQGAFLPEPEVSFSSRIALAIKALENNSFGRMMEMALPLVPVKPDILDNFNMDVIIRDVSRNDGMPARWLVDSEMVGKLRQARAEAQAQQAKQAQAMEAAGALAKVGGVKQDSLAGALLAKQMGDA